MEIHKWGRRRRRKQWGRGSDRRGAEVLFSPLVRLRSGRGVRGLVLGGVGVGAGGILR